MVRIDLKFRGLLGLSDRWTYLGRIFFAKIEISLLLASDVASQRQLLIDCTQFSLSGLGDFNKTFSRQTKGRGHKKPNLV